MCKHTHFLCLTFCCLWPIFSVSWKSIPLLNCLFTSFFLPVCVARCRCVLSMHHLCVSSSSLTLNTHRAITVFSPLLNPHHYNAFIKELYKWKLSKINSSAAVRYSKVKVTLEMEEERDKRMKQSIRRMKDAPDNSGFLMMMVCKE